jgi:hypothetical protein
LHVQRAEAWAGHAEAETAPWPGRTGLTCRALGAAVAIPVVPDIGVMTSRALGRFELGGVAAGPIESALLGVRPYALIVGTALCVLTVLFNVPDNGVLQLRDHQGVGSIAAHTSVLLVAIGLLPELPRVLSYLAALPGSRRMLVLGAWITSTGLVMVAASFLAPWFMRDILTREWGLVEPAQFVLYLLAARLCFSHASRIQATATRLSRLYRAAGWLAVVSALEEVDYLGLVALAIRLAGNPRGRLTGTYVGSLHDLISLLSYHPAAVLPAVVATLAAVLLVVYGARGYLRVLWDQLASVTSWPLLGVVVFMTVAQVADLEDSLLGPISTLGLEVRNLLEEPPELLAVMCLNTTLVLKLTAMSERATVSGR